VMGGGGGIFKVKHILQKENGTRPYLPIFKWLPHTHLFG